MSTVRVLEEFPELAPGLGAQELEAARRVSVRVVSLPEGPRSLEGEIGLDPRAFGLFVLDGLLLRRLEVLGELVCTELLGPGDLLRPWTSGAEASGSIPAEAHWEVTVATRLAVLDRRYAREVARWPEIAAGLLERAVERSRSMHFQLAVCHLVRVEDRILVTLWHLADRFGRMSADGARLPIPLPHRTLASLVGARRQSVTTALGALRDERRVERTEDGWLLRGGPPEELGRLRRETAVGARRTTAR